MRKPAVFYSGNTVVRAGNMVGVRGEYLDQNWKAVLTDGTIQQEIPLLQQNRQSFKFQIPEAFAEGIYTLSLIGDEPLTIVLNEPKVRWMQGDEGETATPNGWVRLQGECLRINVDASPYLELTAEDGSITRLLPERIYDDYSVGFEMNGLKEGSYQAVYSNGYAAGECGTLKIAPSPEEAWGKNIYNVTEYGLSNESVLDCTEALRALLEKAGAEGGGVLYFPRGRYHLTGCFHIPAGVILRGDGYRYTQLFWTDEWRGEGIHENGRSKEWYPTLLPEVMITADSDFAIENLEFAAGRIGRLLRAGTAEKPAKNVRIDNVRVHVNAFAGINGRHHQNQYWAILKETWHIWNEEEHDMLGIQGSNIKIRGCHFNWSGRLTSYGYHMEYLLMQNLYVGNMSSVRYWMPIGELNKAIIEDNEVCNWDVGCGGENIYMSRMNIHDTTCGDKEAFTTDIAVGIEYHGPAVIEEDGISFTFPDHVNMAKAQVGSKLCILSGTGAGQFRYVTKVEGHTVTIAEPFAAAPDATSHLTVNQMFWNWYFTNFTIDNCGMLQMYVAQGNTVVDGMKLTRSAGIKPYGQLTYKGVQNNWYNSVINCTLSEGNCFHGDGWFDYHDNPDNVEDWQTINRREVAHRVPGYSFLYVIGRCDELINLCCTVRGNVLRDECLLYVRSAAPGSVSDLILDANHSEDCRCGIYIEGEPERLLLSGNTSERVHEPIHYQPSWGVNQGQMW
ncbi:MAG: hypothetical protein J6B85_05060 [Lachnospiraceae bacterium]|nr:hypothetical protein [Lachnospiraceae bacterium]